MQLVIIAAVAENQVIGKNGDIPWHLPEDLQHYKQTTMGHPVIMGRKTWEGIHDDFEEGLPGRTNIVMSHQDLQLPDGVRLAHSVDQAIEEARKTGVDTAYIIGGEGIYRSFLQQDCVDRMILSEIPEPYQGDTHFPDWDRSRWQEVDREEHDNFTIVTYKRNET
ncbi:MAG: dihydrofolate reductase [Candidatus Nanohaloarchaea archaeon]|nr:dihydrofolate reductase [Candidatus Nanohaloarchaea archaeon]